MTNQQRLKKTLATILLIVLLGFVAYALLPFLNAFFGAFILYYLFRPLYLWLRKKKWKKSMAGIFILFLVLLVVIIPLTIATKLLVTEVGSLVSQRAEIATQVNTFITKIPGFETFTFSSQQLTSLTNSLSTFFFNMVNNFTKVLISLVVFFFVLYYLLTSSADFNKRVYKYIPFKKKNTQRLIQEFRTITHATIISTGLIAIFQGSLLGLGFLIFGIPNPLLWGFIGMILSFLPVVGISFIWLPTGLIEIFVQHNYAAGIGILIWGGVVSSTDNFSRLVIQKRIGAIHPLITIIGVFMGLPIFGLLGLFIGPLLLSYVLLITKMYVEEYV